MFSLANAEITQNLRYGMRNDQVLELQDFLVSKALLSVSPSGFFGLLTLNAVKTYQVSQNLPNTGFVGQMTRKAINDELSVDVASSTEAEIVEAPPIVFVPAPPIPVVLQPVPQAQPVVIPKIEVVLPTCTLVADEKSINSTDNQNVILDWTSTNATKGVMEFYSYSKQWTDQMDLSKDKLIGGVPQGNSLSQGKTGTITTGLPIRVRFSNTNGEVNCQI